MTDDVENISRLVDAQPPGMAKPLADEAIDQNQLRHQGLQLLFCRAALPLSRQILTYVAGIIRRYRAAIGSAWRKLTPAGQALLVLAYLRTY
jgi:hypothetical protein